MTPPRKPPKVTGKKGTVYLRGGLKTEWALNLDQRKYVDATVFGKTYLAGTVEHVPQRPLFDRRPMCLSCPCCNTLTTDPYYCRQCRVGIRP